jgi:tRNA(fMet)-specific endonuclease VapC
VAVRKYLLDSGIASDFINRRHGVPDRFRAEVTLGRRIGVGTPVLAELVYGIEASQNRDRNMQALRLALPALTLWAFDQKAAFEYGRLAAELRRIGRPMQTVDVMIAAIALSLGDCTVVSRDGDLATVPGLAVENWADVNR